MPRGQKSNPVLIWQCKQCTWFRVKHDSDKWDSTVIDHPLYGQITLGALYILEVAIHDCGETAAARKRFGIDPDVRYNGRDVIGKEADGETG